jgi:hypothetical protein
MRTFFKQMQDREPAGKIPHTKTMEIWKETAQGTHDCIVSLPKAFLSPEAMKGEDFVQIFSHLYVDGCDTTCMSIATRVGDYVVRHQFPKRTPMLPEERAKMFEGSSSGKFDLRPASKCRLATDDSEETVSCVEGNAALEAFMKEVPASDTACDLSVYGFLIDLHHPLTDYVQVRRKDAEGVVHTISLEVLDEPPASVVKK